MKKETENWLKIANNDLKSAEILFNGGCYLNAVEHCHAAVEKLLKGIIAEQKNVVPPKIHDLLALVSLTMIDNVKEDIQKLFDELNDTYIQVRYPDNLIDLEKDLPKEKIGDILKRVRSVYKWLRSQIK